MTGNIFLDTNILLYARDLSEPSKQPVAQEIIAKAWQQRMGRISIQILNEYFVNVTRKLKPGLSAEEAWNDMDLFMAWNPVPIDRQLISGAFLVYQKYGLSWWDSMVISAAQIANCTSIISEDLSHHQEYFGIQVINPFLEAIR
jgi:predicted nucleic acid-binding protein